MAAASPMANEPTANGEWRLPLRNPTDLRLTVASHGWAHLAPWHWDAQTGVLSRAEPIGGERVIVAVAQSGPEALSVRCVGSAADHSGEALRRVRRWVSADWDPREAMSALPEYEPLIRRGGGRMLRCSSFYEDFVKTVLTINAAWSSTCRMAAALVSEPGHGAFPGPREILAYGESRLRERARLGFRAATVISTTGRMLADGVLNSDGDGAPEYEYLLGLGGIGPYAAAHCRLLLHDFSRVPVDSALSAYLRARHDTDPGSYTASRAAWGHYLGLGYRLARLQEKLDTAVPI